MTNPIKGSIAYLVEHGFTEDEAKNIIRAIKDDSKEHLWECAPKWIEWCADIRKQYECIVQLAAMGAINVQWHTGPDDMEISLADGVTFESNGKKA